MVIQRSLRRLAAAVALAATASTAQAALIDRANGMIYDDHANITWLADLNYAQSSGHTGPGVQPDGRMTWDAAVAWAESLSYGGYSDWRLPTLTPSDSSCTYRIPGYGYNCTGGELSHLLVTDLGNKPDESIFNAAGDSPQQLVNQGLFKNAQSFAYWSGTELTSNPAVSWYFYTLEGYQFATSKGQELFAVAVRPGDVLTPVPEPQAWLLMLAGLGAAASVARRRTTRS